MKDEDVGIPGYGLIDSDTLTDPAVKNRTEEEWLMEFVRTLDSLATFVRVRDPFAILAKTSMRHMIEADRERSFKAQEELPPLEQSEVELVQALLLIQDKLQRHGPISLGSFVRFWLTLCRHVSAFIHKQPHKAADRPIGSFISRRARVHTMYYRNIFSKEDCERTVLCLLVRVDAVSERELGYKLSDVYRSLLCIWLL